LIENSELCGVVCDVEDGGDGGVVVLGFEDEEGEDELGAKTVITRMCENLRGILVRSRKLLMC
jgi:hypothetical protein